MALTSSTAIANAALSLLGEGRILSLDGTDEDNRRILCATFFDDARDAVLADYPWNFAMRQATLSIPLASSDSMAVVFGLAYAFALPDNPYCLRVWQTEDNETYKVRGRVLYCDSSSINIDYIARITAYEQWQPMAKMALAAHLAMLVAIPITESTQQFDNMAKLYTNFLARAEETDTQEGTPDVLDSDELLYVRTGALGVL